MISIYWCYVSLNSLELFHLEKLCIEYEPNTFLLKALPVVWYLINRHERKFFSSETTGPIEAKFHMKPPWEWGTKVYSNCPGHMTKMAAMPICGKNFETSSSPELRGAWPWNLVCSIRCTSTTKLVQMITLSWPWPSLRQGRIWSLMLFYGKKVKQWIFKNYCSLWWQSWYMEVTKRVHEPIWISKVKVIHWPWSKVTQIQHFKNSFA